MSYCGAIHESPTGLKKTFPLLRPPLNVPTHDLDDHGIYILNQTGNAPVYICDFFNKQLVDTRF